MELIALVAKGKVTSHNHTYPLGAVNDVLNDLKEGRLQGRGILVPEDAAALQPMRADQEHSPGTRRYHLVSTCDMFLLRR